MSLRCRTTTDWQALALSLVCLVGLSACGGDGWPPDPSRVEPTSHVLSPEEALRAFYLPPGFRIELVASEPHVEDPVAIDFDEDGRMYVAEMRSYMPDLDAAGERSPVGRVSVLIDENGDGRMDRSAVFLDSLVLPRAVKAIEGGVLVGAPPHLIFARDLDGDLRADEVEVVDSAFGSPRSNPEYNPNGLLWGIDNCLHLTRHDRIYCIEEGRLIHGGKINARPALYRGQWGVSMDDEGRFYRNFNEDPLHVDLVSATYFARNPSMVRTRGAYENLVRDKTVWPIRPTPGVNRGYRDAVLRDDSTLAAFTAAGSPVVYRGGAFPATRNTDSAVSGHIDVFVTEPAGNFVRRFVVEGENGKLSAANAYDGAEFLTSSDERFRPVNLFSGPDGALYVVDMYRGVIQHATYVTEYLKQHVRDHGLSDPIGLGRIYRIVHESTDPQERPRLSQASTAEFVDALAHPNGWWRDTAQRLLVERGDSAAARPLRRLARGADDAVTRLHALWALDGIGHIGPDELNAGMSDESPIVRAAAVRLAEAHLERAGVREAVDALRDDEAEPVRRQVAASYGELPWPDRRLALRSVLEASPGDTIVTDLVVSGLRGHEFDFLVDLATAVTPTAERTTPGDSVAGTTPGNTVADTTPGDSVADTTPGDSVEGTTPGTMPGATAAAADTILSDAVAMLAAAHVGGSGREAPQALDEMASAHAAPEWFRRALRRGVDLAAPDYASDTHEVTVAGIDSARYASGRMLFLDVCSVCHGRGGSGVEGVAPALAGSEWVIGPKSRLIRILLDGKEGDQLMPPMRQLTDDEISDILTYIRRAWGDRASPVSADDVDMVRKITSERDAPWTEEELLEIR